MIKKLLLGVLALLMGWCVSINAQVTVLTEDFEQGLPSTWTQDPATGVTAWTVSNSGLTGVTAHGGSNYVSLFTTNQQADTKLILPMTDISSLSTPELSFFLVQKARGVNTGYARDTLRIYARTSSTAAWTLVQTLSDEITVWARQNVDLSAIANVNVQLALEFVYGSGLGIGIDDLRLGDASVCFTPTDLRAYRITSNSAELMWTAYEAAFEYGLKVSTTAMSDPSAATADVLDQSVYFKPYAISGLTPSTTYYFYVSANCGNGDESAWSAAGTFTTACAPETLPYSDAMESTSSYATCWKANWEANGDWSTTTPSATTYAPATNSTHHDGTQSVRLYAYYYNSTSYAAPRTIKSYIASHEINTTDIRNQQITFWGYGSTAAAKVHVGLVSDPTDFSTFEELAVIPVEAASVWKEYTVPFASATNAAAKHICFMADGADGTASFYYYIDDVLVEDIPACPKPSLVQVGNVAHDHATIHWLGSSSAYNVKVSTTPLTNPDTDVADVLTTTVNTASITIPNLSSRTTYYFYVQSNCTAENSGTSVWANVLQFTTTSVAAEVPYSCDFEDATESAQWDLYNGTQTNAWAVGTAIHNGTGTHALYISNDNGISNAYSTSSAISYSYAVRTIKFSPGVYEINFDWTGNGESTWDLLRAFLLPSSVIPEAGNAYGMTGSTNTNPAGWIDLTNGKLNLQTTWQNASYMLSVEDTTIYNLTFFWKNDNGGGTNPPAAVDNVSITAYTCAAPTNIVEGTVTTNSISVSWTPSVLGETQWEAQLLNGGNILEDTVLSTTSVTFNNLAASTGYQICLRSVCGADDFSSWTLKTVMTACDDITSLPYVEDFENTIYGTGTTHFPTCWTKAQSYSASYPYINTSQNHTEENIGNNASLYFYASSSANNMVVLPRVAVPNKSVNNMQISFWMRYSSTSYNMTVGVMTDPTDPSTFTPVQTCTLSAANAWERQEISFAAYTGNGEYIAFFDGINNATNYMYIDDVVLDLLPDCPKPTNVVCNPDENQIRVTWDAIGAPQYEVRLAANGETAETATNSLVVSGNQAVFTNLPNSTPYDVYVRALCSATDTSEWTDAVATATTKVAAQLPLFTDFTDAADNAQWELINGTQTNKWCIGGATGNGDTHALYISNDNGATYAYTTTTALAYSYATRLVKFVPGNYNITFDWMCNGESSYDLLRVFLVPLNVNLTAGNAYGMTGSTNTDPAGWISLSGADTKLNLQTSWQNHSYDFPITDTVIYQLVFFWKDDNSGGTNPPAAVDNLSIVKKRICERPTALSVTGLSNDGAQLNWGSNNALTYNLVVATAEVDPDTVTDVSNDVFMYETGLVDNFLDLSGYLTTNTTYWFYVQADCQAEDNLPSYWSEGYQFTTVCPAYALPYTQNFVVSNPNTGSLPSCWMGLNEVAGTGSSSYIAAPSVYAGNNSYQKSATDSCSLRLSCYNSTTASSKSIAILPEFSGSYAGYRLSFYNACTANLNGEVGGRLLIGTMTDVSDASTFEPVDTLFNTNYWNFYALALDGITNAPGTHLALVWDGDLNQKSGYFYIDQLAIEPYAACEAPTNLRVEVDGGNADVYLNTMSAADSIVEIVLTQGTDILKDTVMSVANLPWSISHLAGLTTYGVRARVVCNAADSTYSAWNFRRIDFTSGCVAMTLPYSYNFDEETQSGSGKRPTHCWTAFQSNGSTTYPYISTSTPSSAPHCLYFYGSTTYASVAVTPELDVTSMQNVVLTFKAKKSSASYDVLVGVMTDPEDLTTFDTIATVTPTTTSTWQEMTVRFNNYSGNGRYIAFLVGGSTSSYMSIDDIYVEYEPTCHRPSAPVFVGNTTNSITASWTASQDNETSWDIVALPAGQEPDANTVFTTVTTNQGTVTGLQPNTAYTFYVRAVCSATDHSKWSGTTMSTACTAVNVTDSTFFTEDFDNNGTGTSAHPSCWTTATNYTTTAYPYISTTHHSGVGSLYFYGTASYYSYAATPQLTGTPTNELRVNFWGYKTSAAYQMEVGVMTDPNDYSTFVTIATVSPDATSTWQEFTIDLTDYTGTGEYVAFRMPSASSYMYLDDVTISPIPACAEPTPSADPVLGTDSIRVTITPAHAEDTQWQVVVTPVATTAAPNMTAAVVDTTISTTQFYITGLTAATNYTIYARTVCSATENSAWRRSNFKTLCDAITVLDSVPYTENFDSYANLAQVDCWTGGQISTTYAFPNVVNAYSVSPSNSLRFNGGHAYITTPTFTNAVNTLKVDFKLRQENATSSGVINVGVMSNPNDFSTFELVQTVSCNAVSTFENFSINIADGGVVGNNKVIAFEQVTPANNNYWFWMDDVVVSLVPACSAPGVSVDLVSSTSVDVTLAPGNVADTVFEYVLCPSTTAAVPPFATAIARDTVDLSGLEFSFNALTSNTAYSLYARALCGTEWTRNDFTTPASCAAPDVNVVFGNGNLYVTLTPGNPTDNAWEVVVNGNANDTTGSIFRQVVTSTTVTVPASYASTFYIHARTSCGNDWSVWTATSITTPCGVVTLPFTETFNTMPPSCWTRYSGLINDVMAGTATLTTTTSGWLANSTYCWQDPHAKINIFGTSYKYWLVTPDLYIDTTAVLSFDLGLTKYASSDPILDPTSQLDDRFVVAVSRDGGNTWTTSDIVAEWNNTGSSHVYNQIATTGERVELSLGNFIGDTIKIAFYGESTVSGGDNDLHLDNVNVTAIHNIVDLTDNICDGYNYVGQGFNLSSNEISLSSNHVFTRLNGDTMYRLTLNVMPSVEIEINDSVCSGNLPYTLYGFNVSASGTYHRYLNTAAGCDSIVTLNLVVKNGYTDSETVTICASALPYLWNGQSLNAAGTYTHTVAGPGGCDSIYTLTLVVNQDKQTTEDVAVCDNELPYTWNGQSLTAAGTYTFNGTTSTGCDSVATLNLTVNATYSNTEYLTLHDYELPYTWNGQEITAAGSYTFNGTTAAGCDSVITLTLTVTVGLDYAEDGMFNITPNPVEKGGVVRIDATVGESAVVELFTAGGKLVARSEHNTEAIYVTMPQVAGLYMVRLTTDSGRVMYGKVIVR